MVIGSVAKLLDCHVCFISIIALMILNFQAIDVFSAVSNNKLTDEEKNSMVRCSTHGKNEHTVRAAIKTVIWDMILSNDKARLFITKQSQSQPVPVSVLVNIYLQLHSSPL